MIGAQCFVFIGGRYWDRTSCPCRVKAEPESTPGVPYAVRRNQGGFECDPSGRLQEDQTSTVVTAPRGIVRMELFAQFMKDFVRVQIYPRIQQFVPSSTREGVEALRKILERNRELHRYEEAEIGDFEGILGDYLKGNIAFTQVLQQAHSRARSQTQTVSSTQVGHIENEVPGVVDSAVYPGLEEGMEFLPSPPIIRDSTPSTMKILTTTAKYPQLNAFTMLLGLSDRLMRAEGEFFRAPHTTRILWGGHRVVYIFTEATGRLNLYYDIELREPISHKNAGGGMFRTTTLITKNRIFVPVPEALAEEFKVSSGVKEFFVRFDVLSNPETPKEKTG